MKKFIVYEVQEETSLRMFKYEIEAESIEEVEKMAKSAGLPEDFDDFGHYGPGDLGESGFHICTEVDSEGWNLAIADLSES